MSGQGERVINGDAPQLLDLFGGFTDQGQGGGLYADCYSSPEACAASIKRQGQTGMWHDSAWSARDESWSGTRNMTEAIKLALEGWQEGAEQARRSLDLIQPHTPTRRKLKRYGVGGALVDIPRFLAGDPQCMLRPEPRASRHKPCITLVSSCSANCMIAGSSMMNRAACAAAIVDAIESQGFACECLVSGASGSDSSRKQNKLLGALVVRVKDAGAALDLGRFAFGMGHASMFRRFGFQTFGRYTQLRPLGHGLGYPYTPTRPQCAAAGSFLLPSFDSGLNERDFRTEELARTSGLPRLIAALREQGCPAFPAEDGNEEHVA